MEVGSERGNRGLEMAVMEKLKMFVVQEPVVAASCLIAGFGISFTLKTLVFSYFPFADNLT